MYKLGPIRDDNKPQMLNRLSDNCWIPPDEANTDYQEYLKWLAEGNTPQPAEE